MENQIVGYARVSTMEQDLKNQRYEILSYASKNDLQITYWVEAKVSSRSKQKDPVSPCKRETGSFIVRGMAAKFFLPSPS